MGSAPGDQALWAVSWQTRHYSPPLDIQLESVFPIASRFDAGVSRVPIRSGGPWPGVCIYKRALDYICRSDKQSRADPSRARDVSRPRTLSSAKTLGLCEIYLLCCCWSSRKGEKLSEKVISH